MPGNVSQKVEVRITIKNATSLTSQMFKIEQIRKHVRTSKKIRDSATSATGFCGTGPTTSARSSGLSAEPDAKALIAHVEHSLGDLLVNCLGSLHESVINVVSSLCTRLQEY